MATRNASRLVYSSEETTCIRCRRPESSCTCPSPGGRSADAAPVTGVIRARLSLETSGRKGKTVTVVGDLPRDPAFLKQLASDLKRRCGSGGSVGDGRVELQGDHRDTIRPLLVARGWQVKG